METEGAGETNLQPPARKVLRVIRRGLIEAEGEPGLQQIYAGYRAWLAERGSCSECNPGRGKEGLCPPCRARYDQQLADIDAYLTVEETVDLADLPPDVQASLAEREAALSPPDPSPAQPGGLPEQDGAAYHTHQVWSDGVTRRAFIDGKPVPPDSPNGPGLAGDEPGNPAEDRPADEDRKTPPG